MCCRRGSGHGAWLPLHEIGFVPILQLTLARFVASQMPHGTGTVLTIVGAPYGVTVSTAQLAEKIVNPKSVDDCDAAAFFSSRTCPQVCKMNSLSRWA